MIISRLFFKDFEQTVVPISAFGKKRGKLSVIIIKTRWCGSEKDRTTCVHLPMKSGHFTSAYLAHTIK